MLTEELLPGGAVGRARVAGVEDLQRELLTGGLLQRERAEHEGEE
jgi:hypothetical protein